MAVAVAEGCFSRSGDGTGGGARDGRADRGRDGLPEEEGEAAVSIEKAGTEEEEAAEGAREALLVSVEGVSCERSTLKTPGIFACEAESEEPSWDISVEFPRARRGCCSGGSEESAFLA